MTCKDCLSKGLRKASDWVIDRIWPRTTNRSQSGSLEFEEYLSNTAHEYHPVIEAELEKLIAQEDERHRSVDRKITSLLAIAPIATTIIIAIVVTAVTTRLDAILEDWKSYLPLLVTLYIGLQLIRAMIAIIHGQGSTSYSRNTIYGLEPRPEETPETHKIRLTNQSIKNLLENQTATNRKVNRMNIAHCAINNAVWATLILVIAACLIAGYNFLKEMAPIYLIPL